MPLAGIAALSRHWLGAGSLYELIGVEDWLVERRWPDALVRARAAVAWLAWFERDVTPFLPRHAAAWLEQLEQEIHRRRGVADVPSAYTDWASTVGEFGRFPSAAYVERIPRGSFDTPFTRTIRWLCEAYQACIALVARELHRSASLPSGGERALQAAFSLPEVRSARREPKPRLDDVAKLRRAGGLQGLVGTAAADLALLWVGNTSERSRVLLETGLLPLEMQSTLFELGVLGTTALAVGALGAQRPRWESHSPIGSAAQGAPCLAAKIGGSSVSIYFQTVPSDGRPSESAYRTLTYELGGGWLRPDIWLRIDKDSSRRELILECKYSADPLYVASGVPQVFAYSVEFGVSANSRVYAVVGPDGVVPQLRAFGLDFRVLPVEALPGLVREMVR